MKNLLRIFVLSTVIWSCNNSDVEVKRLEKENKVLRDSLLMLKKPQPNYINSVKTFTTKNEIKLGEEWTAEVCLSVVEDKNPPRVILCNIKNEDYIPTGDTILRTKVVGRIHFPKLQNSHEAKTVL
jgi:hypothetical protein